MNAEPAAASNPESVAPSRVRVRLTSTGSTLLILAILGTIGSWLLGAGGALFTAACAATVALAPLLAWLHTRALRVGPVPSATTFSGDKFPLEVTVESAAWRLSARDIVLEHATDAGGRRLAGYIPSLAPGQTARLDTLHRLRHRGRFDTHHLTLHTSYPLGLAVASADFELPARFVVLPRLGTLRNLRRLSTRHHGLLLQGTADRGDELEFFGLRNWREGESMRRVHWKLSARRDRLLVREFRGEDRPPVHVVLSTAVKKPRKERARHASFELAVSLTATLLENYLRNQQPVRLTVSGDDGVSIGGRRGRAALFPMLRALVDAAPVVVAGEAPLPATATPRNRRSRELTIIVRAGGAPAPGERARTDHTDDHTLVIDVDDPRTADLFSRARAPGRNPLETLFFVGDAA